MTNDTIRIAIGLRIGAPLCMPHTCCHCGKDVDHYGRHGLSCRSSQGRTSRHQILNEVIHRSLTAAKVPCRLEPSGLYRADGKRPDGVTTIPWSKGKPLVWDATCVDTFCHSVKQKAAQETGGAATHAEKEKVKKYAHLDHAYIFQPIAFETSGTIGYDSMCFLRDLGRRLRSHTGEVNSFVYLLQRLSVAIQVGNSTFGWVLLILMIAIVKILFSCM